MNLNVIFQDGKKFSVTCRGHQLIVDQPVSNGGADAGMTPPELFVASLATCIGVYIVNYCQTINMDTTTMTLEASWDKASQPARIGAINVSINLPGLEENPSRKEAILRVAEHCLVHNTVTHPPQITINLT